MWGKLRTRMVRTPEPLRREAEHSARGMLKSGRWFLEMWQGALQITKSPQRREWSWQGKAALGLRPILRMKDRPAAASRGGPGSYLLRERAHWCCSWMAVSLCWVSISVCFSRRWFSSSSCSRRLRSELWMATLAVPLPQEHHKVLLHHLQLVQGRVVQLI